MNESFHHHREHIDENVIKLEVNLDDMSPEWLGYVLDKLFEAGANDAFYIPIYMKKNRPAALLQVLCQHEKLSIIKKIIFEETTTLGIRYSTVHVHRLARRFRQVETEWGTITIKEGLYNGTVVQVAPEYEDCKRIAEQEGVPLKHVFQTVWKSLQTED